MRKVYITADIYNPVTEEESHGWIDWNWSRTQLHENKEDVRTLELEDDENVWKFIENLIGEIDLQSRSTYYAADSVTDYVTGLSYTYAAHVEQA